MYKNSELELLKNNQKRLASTELDEAIKAIDLYYNDFNNNCVRFTTNYITTMTNLFNQFSIQNLISTAYGGTIYDIIPIIVIKSLILNLIKST